MLPELNYVKVSNINKLLELLHVDTRILAGGTDLIPNIRKSDNKIDGLIDISGIKKLKSIEIAENKFILGALTTFSDVIINPHINKYADILVNAAKQVGSPMIRNRGTIGGNIANASPAADIVLPLLVLDASLIILERNYKKTLLLKDIYNKNGKTILANDAIILHIQFNEPDKWNKTIFLKIGNRRGMVIAVASLAVNLRLNEKEIIDDIKIAVGSVAPAPIRCYRTEQFLYKKKPSEEIFQKSAIIINEEISPVTDIRSTETYRRNATRELLIRALRTLTSATGTLAK